MSDQGSNSFYSELNERIYYGSDHISNERMKDEESHESSQTVKAGVLTPVQLCSASAHPVLVVWGKFPLTCTSAAE